jgi:hypothetical protein
LLADRRADAVGSNEEVRFDNFAIGKMHPDAISALSKFGHSTAAMVAIGREGIAQQSVDPFPCCQDLWAAELMSELSARIEYFARRDVNTKLIRGETKAA